MSEKRKDLLSEPNKRGFAPIVTKPGAEKKLSKGMDGDEEGGEDEEDEEQTEKSKVKKGMPPGLAAAQEAKGGKAPDKGGDAQEDEQASEQEQEQSEGKKPSPPPFMKKGGKHVTTDDLEKSLGKLQAFVAQDDQPSRKDALLSKAQSEELSKSEAAELYQLLGGGASKPAKASVAEEVTKGLVENDTLQKALDVSDYLQEQHTALTKSLSTLGDCLEQSGNRQHDFNLVLAKAVGDIGNLVKSLVEGVEGIATQPARAPKSKLGAQNTLQKGFGGQPPAAAGSQLSKSQIMDGMEALLHKSTDGVTTRGENILQAISKYESTNLITKSMMDAVQQELGAAAH